MSWEEFQTFLMNSQPFRLRRMFYQLNQKGANLSMLGSQREQVNRLMERFRRIPMDQQRQVFPEYFRDRSSSVRHATQRQNGQSNASDDNHSNNSADVPTRRFHAHQVNRPTNSFINRPPTRSHQLLTSQPPAGIQRLDIPRGQYTSNSRSATENQPQTPHHDLRPSLPLSTFNFPSPLRLSPTSESPQSDRFYQLTPHPRRRVSFSGSPAPPPRGESRRRSMSVSIEDKASSVTATKTEDGGGKMANLECKICMDEMVECAFKPCGHACSCYDCARHLRFSLGRCPICRAVITEVIRIYW